MAEMDNYVRHDFLASHVADLRDETKVKEGKQARLIAVDALNTINDNGGGVESLFDGQYYINLLHLMSTGNTKTSMMNANEKAEFKYIPLGKGSSAEQTVKLYLDDIPKKESEKKLPMTSRGVHSQLLTLDRLLDKIIGKEEEEEEEAPTPTTEGTE